MTTYTVIWFSGNAVQNESAPFSDFDAAKDWAKANVSPEVDGRTLPNIPEDLYDDNGLYAGHVYQAGCFWLHNRYAAIVSK